MFVGCVLNFIWDDNNLRHLASHGVTREIAEAVFLAGKLHPSRIAHRYSVEATIGGRDYRLICDVARDGAIYPVTAYTI